VTTVAPHAGPAPFAPDSGDGDMADLLVAEPVAAVADEFDDALGLLAALLLDAQAAHRIQGNSPTPSSASSRPDVRRRESRPSPRPAGGEAA